MNNKNVYIRVALRLGDSAQPFTAYAFHATVDLSHSINEIKENILTIAKKNIKDLSSTIISNNTIYYIDVNYNTQFPDPLSHVIAAGIHEIVLDMTVDPTFKPSTRGIINNFGNTQIQNLMIFLSVNIMSFFALSAVIPASTDYRFILFTGMILSSNIATIFLHPKIDTKEACYNALCNTALGAAVAAAVGVYGFITTSDPASLIKETREGALLAIMASAVTMKTLYDPVYGREYTI